VGDFVHLIVTEMDAKLVNGRSERFKGKTVLVVIDVVVDGVAGFSRNLR